ncbi:MAG: hypothetical protein ACETWG_08910 [Candidatus Neomarinimicrobiota bacterium]
MILLFPDYQTSEPEVGKSQQDTIAGRSVDLRIWFRRKFILKLSLFFLCFVGVGLVSLLLDS